MTPSTFDQFRDEALRQGCDEALVREWAPGHETPVHEHPFDTRAVVVRGEFWLTVDGQTRHLKTGERFELARHSHAAPAAVAACRDVFLRHRRASGR